MAGALQRPTYRASMFEPRTMTVWEIGEETEEVRWGHFMLLEFSMRLPDHEVVCACVYV